MNKKHVSSIELIAKMCLFLSQLDANLEIWLAELSYVSQLSMNTEVVVLVDQTIGIRKLDNTILSQTIWKWSWFILEWYSIVFRG